MEEQAITALIVTVLPMLGGLLVAVKKWFNISEKIKSIRILMDSVDDALRDDKITEGEFRTIFGNYKVVVNS
ncbi:MAG: hypothetical protein HRU07_01280 [Nitrosopumilus sp.]|nr:hypothetical protein [Nitrosopumilus sp.]NRA04806.1 hypothetical protein [Nitrosopumilus sp.]